MSTNPVGVEIDSMSKTELQAALKNAVSMKTDSQIELEHVKAALRGPPYPQGIDPSCFASSADVAAYRAEREARREIVRRRRDDKAYANPGARVRGNLLLIQELVEEALKRDVVAALGDPG